MKNTLIAQEPLDRYVDCFGEFNAEDPVCKRVCALRLRCAVDSTQKDRISLIDELFNSDELVVKLH